MTVGKRPIFRHVLAWCVIGCLSVVLCISFVLTAQAYNLLGGRWPNQPVKGVCCAHFHVQYLGMSSKDSTGWDNGRYAWNVSPANFDVYPYQSAVISMGDYNFGSNGCGGCDGITYLNPCNSCTYTSASLYENSYYTSMSQYTAAVVQSVTAHEIGHMVGLAHSNGCVLMNPYTFGSGSRWGGCGINAPRSDDVNGVNAQY